MRARTVTITEKLLEARLGACDARRAGVHLPVILSTDPVDNLDVAVAAIDGEADLHWLVDRVVCNQGRRTCLYDDLAGTTDDIYNSGGRSEPYVVAQLLAWVADALINRPGDVFRP